MIGIGRGAVKFLFLIVIWGVFWVLTIFIPRRKDWIAVIGRDDGRFLDNAKYFYLESKELLPDQARCVFVSEWRDVVESLEHAGYQALHYPSRSSIWFLLRAGSMVSDVNEWTRNARRFLLMGAKLVQLWHGVPLKEVQLERMRSAAARKGGLVGKIWLLLRIFKGWMAGTLVRYDLISVSSTFFLKHVFQPSFYCKHFFVNGYPRNTFGMNITGSGKYLVWNNVEDGLKACLTEWVNLKKKIILVAPTFRDTGPTPIGLDPRTCRQLDIWCRKYKAELLFKFHPREQGVENIKGEHLHVCGQSSDIYPVIPYTDALVTDYSSIYFDYLFNDAPIVFLNSDMDVYNQNDREFYFEYETVTPGPKVRSWASLCDELVEQWQRDGYANERLCLKKRAFDNLSQHDSTKNIINFMMQKNWFKFENF